TGRAGGRVFPFGRRGFSMPFMKVIITGKGKKTASVAVASGFAADGAVSARSRSDPTVDQGWSGPGLSCFVTTVLGMLPGTASTCGSMEWIQLGAHGRMGAIGRHFMNAVRVSRRLWQKQLVHLVYI